MVNNILKQLPKNPDARLTDSATRYFKHLPRSDKKISVELIKFLESPINLFPYQEARIITVLRYLREIPTEIIKYARKSLRLRSKHWYVKVQCALLLANLKLQTKNLRSLRKLYENETNTEVKRSLVSCLCQLDKDRLSKFLRDLVFENNNRLSLLGQMLLNILYNHKDSALIEISNLFRHFDEHILLDSYYKMEVIKYCKENKVREDLLKRLKSVRGAIKRVNLKARCNETIKFIENSLARG